MIVARRIPWSWTFYYGWRSLFYFLALGVVVFVLHDYFGFRQLDIPYEPVGALATALAIFLGFKANNAYDRWWEARIIWGLLVNLSRAWTRQVLTMLEASPHDADALKALQTQLVYRHIAFVHALRVFLRAASNWPQEGGRELVMASNRYQDALNLLDRQEGKAFCEADNPPNYLLHKQGEDLRGARDRGWMTEYVFVHLDRTLVEFNHIQGRCERIKQTPLPRPYSYFQRMFVHIHGTLMPFAFVQQLHWVMIPLSLIISFVFLTLDLVAARTEDPFENRIGDVPLSALSRNIEITLREQLGESALPPKPAPVDGVLL